MNRIVSFLVSASFLYFPGAGVHAADTLHVNLDQALQMAFARSLDAAKAREDSAANAGSWRAARGNWFPQASLNAIVPSWDKYRYGGSSTTSESWSGGVHVNQLLPWGATLSLGSSFLQLKNTTDGGAGGMTAETYRLYNTAALSQPLLAGNPAGRRWNLDKINRKSSLLRHQITLRDLKFQVISSFYALVQAEAALNIARQDYEQGRSSAELADRKLKAGLIPEVESLQIQVDVARRESAVKDAESSVATAMENLRINLGAGPETVIIATAEELDGELPLPPVEPSIERRPDARVRAMGLQAEEIRTKSELATTRLDASLDLSYYGSSLTGTIDGQRLRPQNETVGLDLIINLPVFGFGSTSGEVQRLKANLRSARLNYRLEMERLAADQREAFRRLDRAKDRIELSKRALDLAQRSYDITAERFANGLISSRELLDAQIELTRNRREAVNARIEYRLALSAIERFAPESEK